MLARRTRRTAAGFWQSTSANRYVPISLHRHSHVPFSQGGDLVCIFRATDETCCFSEKEMEEYFGSGSLVLGDKVKTLNEARDQAAEAAAYGLYSAAIVDAMAATAEAYANATSWAKNVVVEIPEEFHPSRSSVGYADLARGVSKWTIGNTAH